MNRNRIIRLKSYGMLLSILFCVLSGYGQEQLDSTTVAKLTPAFLHVNGNKPKIDIPEIEGYKVNLIGSDNKVIIDLNGRVSSPLVDKEVNLLFKVTRLSDAAYAEIPVKDIYVKGRYQGTGVGELPFVIPSLREWHGEEGYYALNKETAIVISAKDKEAGQVAELLKDDIRKMFGLHLIVKVGTPKKGDIFITASGAEELGEEGYSLHIDDVFTIKAKYYKGKVFATRTLLQLLDRDRKALRIPKGESRDYPTYEVRGFVIDVARKFFTIDFLNDYVEILSYYKLSDFHIHLTDNGFHKFFNFDWDSTYAAFRLENERYPNLTSRDGHYSKSEFIDLQKKALRYGVTIIPEIDVPAHSLAISHAIPEVGSKKFGMDHLDLDNPKTYEVVKNIFDEYTKGDHPVFLGEEVHVGTDEYDKKEAEPFRKFTDFVFKTVQDNGKKVRAWGALTHAQGKTPVRVKDVTLNMWYNGYADPLEMKKLGYSQISTPDGFLYIVPAAGYYYDYLNTDYLYNNWSPRNIGSVTFEKGDPILRGGSFAVWNDVVGNGVSQKDVHNRVFPGIQVLAEKMWTAEDQHLSLYSFNEKRRDVREAPGLNLRGHFKTASPLFGYFDFESQADNKITNEWKRAEGATIDYVAGVKGKGLHFSTPASTLKMPIDEIGEHYTVSFWIKPEKELNGNLFVSKNATISANEQGLGFDRDGYHYDFDCKLPVGEWSFVAVVADAVGTQFFRNGELVKDMKPFDVVKPYKDKNDKEIKFKKIQTLVFPLAEIKLGQAVLDELKIYNEKLSAQEIRSEYRIVKGEGK